MKQIFFGVLAALFFSSTFVLNRAMSLDGGHWVWSASLRYFWMLILLLAGFALFRPAMLRESMRLFFRHWIFWTLAGSIGFGAFYALLTFSASYTPGWVVATTWQSTILATPLVLLLFGRPVPLRAVLLTGVVFAGVVLVNMEQSQIRPWQDILLGALPVFAAAIAYPLGNQLVWEASQKKDGANSRSGLLGRVPEIRTPAMGNAFCKVLLMSLGSVPLWGVLIAVTAPPAPSPGQLVNTFLVALLSGVAATSLFLYARNMARTAAQISAVDCTQSMEVIFSLAGETVLLNGLLPGPLGWAGLGLTMAGLMLYLRVQNVR
ncbi:MAG: multidrug resistance efflux transporter family protein [Desulfovibrio sp.]|uniref:DMT family transporter n=1 Tax=Desulfovibrio sp. 7SRBS1 TaxID=3378064 RepID=UPI003B3D9DE5